MLKLYWQELESEEEKSYSTFFAYGSAISIGSFDGLHKGHCALLKRLVKKAREAGLPSGVLTFLSLPRCLFNLSSASCISTLRLKLENLEKLGLDFVILVDFSFDFAKMSGEYFMKLLKQYINLKYLLVGEDFRFGRERTSSIEDMYQLSSKFSFSFEAFSNICESQDETKVSSSLIRKAIYEGNLEFALSFLENGLGIDLLNVKPYRVGKQGFCFLREDLQQVLPKNGEFFGILSLSNRIERNARVVFNERCVELTFDELEFNEDIPHFNILKLKEKI